MTCLLVVDTSVIQAAGESEHPVSSACRNCLLAICTICHHVAVTDSMRDEWNSHMSRFSRKWRTSMAARGKPIQIVDPESVYIDVSGLSERERTAVEKDCFLVEAALATDSVVVTRDDEFRRILTKTPQGANILSRIRWINPVNDGVGALEKL